jgi:uncharacterized protein
MSGYLGLIVKATRRCNLRCSYCHDWRAEREQTMRFEVLARMTQAALQGSRAEAVEFMWHGGETLLMPKAFYEKALYLQARMKRPEQRVSNSLQTNATLLTPEWAQFLRWHGFQVSISLDGPPAVHDRYRIYPSGRGSSREVARGMQLLRDHEIPFSVLMVIDEGALELGPDRIFDYFLEHEIRSFALLAATPHNDAGAAPGTPARHYIEPTRMTEFLARIYDRWLEHGDPGIRIREIEALRQRIHGAPARACTFAGGCHGKYFSVEPNGDVAHCDLYVGDAGYTLGNVRELDFAALQSAAGLAALRDEDARAVAHMRQACPEFSVCNGWCPHERYLSQRHAGRHDPGCCGLRDLIAHMRGRTGATAHAAGG